jgi:2'-5' RNA ligase
MNCDPICTDRTNQFALVGYIPGALGDFLDTLREELVTGCNPHAHVTVLPPRPIDTDFEANKRTIEERLDGFSPFLVEIDGIHVFKETNVIYAGLGAGAKELKAMHQALNVAGLAFKEPFAYHPHLTLAQGLDPAAVPAILERAIRRWEDAPASSFVVDTLTFVKNLGGNHWIDLVEYELTPVRVRR